MRYLLDTDIILYYLKGNLNVFQQVNTHDTDDIYTSAINVAELYVGLNYQNSRSQEYIKTIGFISRLKVISFDRRAAVEFGRIKKVLDSKGMKIDDMDLLVAAIALEGNMTLVTNNNKHYKRIKGLKLENWVTQK